MKGDSIVIEQIKVGFDNFSYVIYCTTSKKAAIVDPGFNASKALDFISSHDFELEYIINTHYHSDHTGDNKKVKNMYPSSKIVASKSDGEKLDVDLNVNTIYDPDGNILSTI